MAKKTYPTLLSTTEIRRIASRAYKVLDMLGREPDDSYDPEARERSYHLERGAKEALRFCATAAALSKDIKLMPLVVQALEIQEYWNDQVGSDTEVVAQSFVALLQLGAPVTKAVRRLAHHDDVRLRTAVASGLQPRDDGSRALLDKLARDPVYEVRRPAHETLAKVGDVPWWLGKFQSDPKARLSPDELAKHEATLDQLSGLLDVPRYDLFHRQQNIAEIASSLPDELAIDLALTTLSIGGFDRPLTTIGTMMVSRKGGPDAFVRLCQAWATQPYSLYAEKRVEMVSNASEDVRWETCMALARFACSSSSEQRHKQGGAADIAAHVAGKTFPSGADLAPLLALILEVECSEEQAIREMDWAISGLSAAFSSEAAVPGSIADQLIAARLEGYPGVWKRLRQSADKLISKIPREVLRPKAERALHHLDDDTVRWAMQCLVKEAHDETRDPPPHQLVADMCEDARLRRIVLKSIELRKMALPWLRNSLNANALNFDEAAAAVSVIDGFWVSMDPSPFLSGTGRAEMLERDRAKERERYARLLETMDAPHGSVTEDEWNAFRRMRDSDVEPRSWRSALLIFPKGPWNAADRAFFNQAVMRCRAGENDLALPLAHALASKCTVDDLPIFDQILPLAGEHKAFIKRCVYDVRVSLGLPTRTPEAPKPQPAPEPPKKTRPRLFLVPEVPEGATPPGTDTPSD